MVRANAWRIGRLGGVEVRIDPSWSVIALLIAYTFFLVLGAQFDELGLVATIGLAVAMALVFFGSVLAHELAHSWVALARGIEVRGITLFLFGGATHADLETEDPSDELWISAVGPFTSLVLAGLLWLVSLPLPEGPIGFAVGYLAVLNLALAVFNLVPGFPLDGGRILRSLVWRLTGDLVRATRVAARAGRFVGFAIVALGFAQLLFLGALIGGLWLVAIGWFLAQAARASFANLAVKAALEDVRAARVMTRDLVTIPAGITIDQAIDDYFMAFDFTAFPVGDGDDTTGILTLRAVREVPGDERSEVRVVDVMEPLADHCVVTVDDELGDVVGKLMGGDIRRVVVVDGGTVVGLISSRDLVRWLERSRELGREEASLRLTPDQGRRDTAS